MRKRKRKWNVLKEELKPISMVRLVSRWILPRAKDERRYYLWLFFFNLYLLSLIGKYTVAVVFRHRRRGSHILLWNLWAINVLLGFELRTFRRAVSALKHSAISPAPDLFFIGSLRVYSSLAGTQHPPWPVPSESLFSPLKNGLRGDDPPHPFFPSQPLDGICQCIGCVSLSAFLQESGTHCCPMTSLADSSPGILLSLIT